jgi:hypothetical protein
MLVFTAWGPISFFAFTSTLWPALRIAIPHADTPAVTPAPSHQRTGYYSSPAPRCSLRPSQFVSLVPLPLPFLPHLSANATAAVVHVGWLPPPRIAPLVVRAIRSAPYGPTTSTPALAPKIDRGNEASGVRFAPHISSCASLPTPLAPLLALHARARDGPHRVPHLFLRGGEAIGGRPQAGRQRRRRPRFDVTYNGRSV